MYSNIAANKRKTVYLIIAFILLIGLVGWFFSLYAGDFYITIAVLIGAIIYALIGYFASAKIALSLNGAKQIVQKDNPRLYRIVENLSITAGLPMPKVYIINDPAPNAFATGRDPQHAHVAATTGLLEMLEDEELEGVMAHEMSHVGNYDIRVMGIVLVLVTIIALLSDIFLRMMWFGGKDRDSKASGPVVIIGIVALIIAPIVAGLLKLAVSRKREYLADASGVLLTRYPDGLVSALEKIGQYNRPMRKVNSATSHLFFSNPLRNKKGSDEKGFAHLFSTHPPIAKRIEAINDMSDKL